MPHVLVIQHSPADTLGSLADALAAAGLMARVVRAYAGEAVPETPGDARGLVLLGGPMGAYDQAEFPFLEAEYALLDQALATDLPILGICLGSQLLAVALGGTVSQMPRRELGWLPIRMSADAQADPLWGRAPAEWVGFHWHGDAFSLPPGAVSLAGSELTPHQIFRHGTRVYGLQCHLEVTPQVLEDMVAEFADELAESDTDADALVVGADAHLSTLRALADAIFGGWAALASSIDTRNLSIS